MNIVQWKPGMVIEKPGIYAGVPMHVYHGADLTPEPSISSSGLRKIVNESPAHYWVDCPYNKQAIERKEREAFTLGRAAHHLLLGEEDFRTNYVVRPEKYDSWRTTESKQWKMQQEMAGRTVLLKSDIEIIRGMAASLGRHPLINPQGDNGGILNGLVEHTIVWQCKDTGVWCKARPDVIPLDSDMFADLKTTTSVLDDELKKTIAQYAYHQQGALIGEGWHAVTGGKASMFSLVFVEKSPPFCCRVVALADEDLIRGERQNLQAKKVFAECLKTGEWPGPGSHDGEFMYLPTWAQTRIDRALELLEAAE